MGGEVQFLGRAPFWPTSLKEERLSYKEDDEERYLGGPPISGHGLMAEHAVRDRETQVRFLVPRSLCEAPLRGANTQAPDSIRRERLGESPGPVPMRAWFNSRMRHCQCRDAGA